MNANLSKLIEVKKFDLEISKFNPLIEEKKAPIYQKTHQKEKYEKEKMDLELKIQQNEDLLIKSNDDLEGVSIEIEKIQNKIKETKSEKEIKNLSMEEDILKERITAFNNEIESLERQNEQAKSKIVTLEESIQRIDDEMDSVTQACDIDVAEIIKQQDAVSERRRKVALGMETALLRLYEKIRKWAGDSSVSVLYKNACGGCFIRLSDKNIIDIKRSEEIIHCPHCGRILYDAESLNGKAGDSYSEDSDESVDR